MSHEDLRRVIQSNKLKLAQLEERKNNLLASQKELIDKITEMGYSIETLESSLSNIEETIRASEESIKADLETIQKQMGDIQ